MALISKIKSTHDSVDYNIRDDVHTWGGRNLIYYTKNFFVTGNRDTGWTNSGSWTFSTDSEGFVVASKAQTGQTSNNIPSLYANRIPVNIGDIIVVSCWMKIEVLNNNEYKIPYIFEVYNSSGTRVQYQDVAPTAANSNKPTLIDNTWTYFYSTHTVTASDAVTASIRLSLFRNGTMAIKKVKLEKGNKPTDWSPAPEDIAYVNGTELVLLS